MNVLFVCNGNVARSQEAEVFFNNEASKGNHATSAGTDVTLGKPLDPAVIEVMREIGFDLTGAYRKFVTEEMVKEADKVVSFKPADELPTYLAKSKKLECWTIPDPRGQSIEVHRKARDDIKALVDKLI